MAVMGFSFDPGPLPFVTIRDRDKWSPRLTNGCIEIVGEASCRMPLQMARVVLIADYDGPAPAHLPFYAGRKLIVVHLDLMSPQKRVG